MRLGSFRRVGPSTEGTTQSNDKAFIGRFSALITGGESVFKPDAARTADRIGRDMDSAAGTSVRVSARSAPGFEFDATDRAGGHIGRHAGRALRARERPLRDRGKADAADAFGRLLGNETTARRTLIEADGQLRLPWPSPVGGRLFVHLLEIVDDLGEGPFRTFPTRLSSRHRPARRDAAGTVRAARAARKSGTAMLASVQFERREVVALPAKNLRHRAQLRHQLADLAPRVYLVMRTGLDHRSTPLRLAGTGWRFPAHHNVGQKILSVIIKAEFADGVHGSDGITNPLREAPFFWRPDDQNPRVRGVAVRGGPSAPRSRGLDVHPRGRLRPVPPDEGGPGPHRRWQRRPRHDADPQGDEALLLPTQRTPEAPHEVGVEGQGALAASRAHVHAKLAPGGAERSADHAGPRLGRRGAGPWVRIEADLCVVRGRDGIPHRDARVVPPPRSTRGVEVFVVRSEGPALLLHRERQHRLPYDYLARLPPRVRRGARPTLRCPGDPVSEHLGGADECGPRAGRVAARSPRSVRPGPAPLLRDRDDSGDEGYGLRMGGLRPAEQQRAPRCVRELCAPRPHVRGQEFQPRGTTGGLPRRGGQVDGPRNRTAVEEGRTEPRIFSS